MFSVPYDFNLYSSWYGLAIFNSSTPANEELYKEMYYGKESENASDRKRAKVFLPILININDTTSPASYKKTAWMIDFASGEGWNHPESGESRMANKGHNE